MASSGYLTFHLLVVCYESTSYHYGVLISISFAFKAYSLIGFIILLSVHVFYDSMTGVHRYTMQMTILVPLVLDFDIGFTFDMIFLDGAWIYIVAGTISYLFFFFFVHP